MLDSSWPGWGLMQSGISAGAGLLGVIIGGLAAVHSQKVERKNSRIREQIHDFYSPLLGIREEIRAKSEMRTKIHSAVNTAWQKQIEIHNRIVPEEVTARFDKVFAYSNEQLV